MKNKMQTPVLIKSENELADLIIQKEKTKFSISYISSEIRYTSLANVYSDYMRKDEIIDDLKLSISKIGLDKSIEKLKRLSTYSNLFLNQ